ncbi:hypothetical protein B0I35DRAFT_480583 [Stachybotrys elegans]|uniref:S-adenosyl-L-methionine-dependent N-methyltransferase n=1 Tax=Stachybotrys elegans TaxID=80388 RepID=A0A8K0SPD6_9HYPO|nr:hypothetical protein B0I35DRAFT_480583 [Stachybotrys elegans]
MASTTTEPPSRLDGLRLALFGPQVTNCGREITQDILATFQQDQRLEFARQVIDELPSFCKSIRNESIGAPSVVKKLEELQAFLSGTPCDPQGFTNTHLAPLTIILQTVHLIRSQPLGTDQEWSLPDFEDAQGFCIGFLSAAALASAHTQKSFEQNISNAIRLAACIGAVVDAEDALHVTRDKATAISMRWKTAADRAFLDACIESTPGAYVSCNTDDTAFTVTLPIGSVDGFLALAREHKIIGVPIGLHGSYHDPRHHAVADIIKTLCAENDNLRLPSAETLRLPLRATVDGHIIESGALHDAAIDLILCKRAHWFQTVKLAIGTVPVDEVVFRAHGGACIPRSLSPKPQHRNLSSDDDKQNVWDEIAVVGMACRFPKAENLDEFWRLLEGGKTAVGEVPVERFDAGSIGREPKLPKFYGNFLDNPDAFDHRFFGISGREAKSMDPQQRLALQVAYEALESSGYFRQPTASRNSDIGCYLGVGAVDYEDNVASSNATAFSATGTLRAFISGRISHFFGWSGPSITLDTACSSSAVAIHTACKALLGGECSMALAGGVNVITSPKLHQNLAAGSFLNPKGCSRAFDANAGGYCRGEGAGIIILKPLSQAVADGDRVIGVIAGSAINQNSNLSSITVPDSGSQSALYTRVLQAGKIAPEEITYVEAHGTGTLVGDPIEYESVRRALSGPSRDQELFIGSVKDNIGHTEAASGAAGVIKSLLMMQHGTVPKQANFISLHPQIKTYREDRIVVPTTTQDWRPRRKIALVNNYGASGSNAAVLLREYRVNRPVHSGSEDRPSIFPLLVSAKTTSHLTAYVRALEPYLLDNVEKLGDIALKLARSHNSSFDHRIAITASNAQEAIDKLALAASSTTTTAELPVVLCFGGQTGRRVLVSKELYENSDVFRGQLNDCDAACNSLGLPSIFPDIFEGTDTEDIVALHCMLLASQVASAMTWIHGGLQVDTLIGHSFGQLAALCVAGSITLEDSFKLISGRARLVRDTWGPEGGAMLSVECSRAEIESIVTKVEANEGLRVDIACYNGPRSFVLAGDRPSIERAASECAAFKTSRLGNTHAYHSYLSDGILEKLADVARSIDIRPPTLPVETCTAGGNWSSFTAEQIVQHTRQPVYFDDAVQRIAGRLQSAVWLEAGSATPIISMARRAIARPERSDIFLPIDLGGARSVETLAKTTCDVWKAGAAVQYWPFQRASAYRYQDINIPPYQFDKTSHWLPLKTATAVKSGLVTLQHDGGVSGPSVFSIDASHPTFQLAVKGHAVAGHSLCPASMYIELAARCASELPSGPKATSEIAHVEGLTMSAPLGLGTESVSCELTPRGSARRSWTFTISSRRSTKDNRGDTQTEHARGNINWVSANDAEAAKRIKWLQRFGINRSRSVQSSTGLSGSMVYTVFSSVVDYAEYYRRVQSISAMGNEAVGQVANPANMPPGLEVGQCDPVSIDSFLQVAGIHTNCLCPREPGEVLVCTALEEVLFSAAFTANRASVGAWAVYTRSDDINKSSMVNDIFVCDAQSGDLMVAILGAVFHSVAFKSLARTLSSLNRTINLVPATLPVSMIATTTQTLDSDAVLDSGYGTGTPSTSELHHEKQSIPYDEIAVTNLETEAPVDGLDVLQSVRSLFASILEMDVVEIPPEAKLDELGVDSLLVTEVLNEIATQLYADLSQKQFALCDDIASVARLITAIRSGGSAAPLNAEAVKIEKTKDRMIAKPGPVLGPSDERQAGDKSPVDLAVMARTQFAVAKETYDKYSQDTAFTGFCTKVLPLQSSLVTQYVVSAFSQLGFDLSKLHPGERVPEIPFIQKHAKLIPQLYKILEDAGLVEREADNSFRRTTASIPTTPAPALHDEMLKSFPQHVSETLLLHKTAPKLAQCLSGTADPLGLLFGDSATRNLLGDVYTNAPMFKTGTLVLAQYLSSLLSSVAGKRELRILELGAGTGGTSQHIIQTLAALGPDHPFTYTFTDLSPSLVASASRKFSKWPMVRYKVLNIEEEPAAEFVGAYDIILSTNCIHATADLVHSTTNIKKMLRPDGLLCLVELTRNLYWFDLVFGLLEGWWLFKDDRSHALADERRWKRDLERAGFGWVEWSDTSSPESDILRVITASPSQSLRDSLPAAVRQPSERPTLLKETVTFKEIDGLKLDADIYYPDRLVRPGVELPVALMIHGGGHIMLSRDDIRPQQTATLLEAGFLPISIDYRLCPETTLLNGPMDDVSDALAWARTVLPELHLSRDDIQIADRVVAVGWSTGGQLAMSLAWTSSAKNIRPPEAVFALYSPTDYEDPFWLSQNIPEGSRAGVFDQTITEYQLDEQAWAGVFDTPITRYNVPPSKRALGGWMAPSDPRSRIALYMNWHGRTLDVLLNGLDKNDKQRDLATPTNEAMQAISPLAQVRKGTYKTPTFLIHPRQDDLIPWRQAERTWQAMLDAGIDARLEILEDVPHLFDILPSHRGNEAAASAVREGYRFLCEHVGLAT